MISIHLIALGKLKEEYWREAEAEYLKRLRPYVKIIIHELKEEAFDEKSNADVIKKKEAEKIKDTLSMIKDNFVIVMDEHGKQFSSVELSRFTSNETIEQWNNVTFVIGGPLGLDKSIVEAADLVLSMSKFTFTHQMARIILMEQVYRGMMIAHNRKYHY